MVQRRWIGLGLAASLALPRSGWAHGPTRQKVMETIEIAALPEKVWAALGSFDDMSWHPAITGVEGRGGTAVDATRLLTFKNGAKIEEVLAKYDPSGMVLATRFTVLDLKALPVNNYSSTLILKPGGAGTVVEWRTAFYRGYPNNDPPPELNDAAAVAAVTAFCREGLAGLKSRVETTG